MGLYGTLRFILSAQAEAMTDSARHIYALFSNAAALACCHAAIAYARFLEYSSTPSLGRYSIDTPSRQFGRRQKQRNFKNTTDAQMRAAADLMRISD